MKNSLDKGSAKKTNKRGQFGNTTKNYAVVHRKEKEDVLNNMISKKVLVSVEKDTEGVKMENINENINGDMNESLNNEIKGSINESLNEEMKGSINESPNEEMKGNIKENINENINKCHKEMESKDGVKEILVTQEISHEDAPTENQILITEGELVNQVEENSIAPNYGEKKSSKLNKMTLKKEYRIAWITLFSLLAISCLVYGLYRWNKVEYTTVTTPLMNYQLNSNIQYKVNLDSNKYLPQDLQEQSTKYITKLINSINFTMDSELFTSSEANIVGDYTAVVTVRGYQNNGESKEVMWRLDKELGHKEFELMDASEWSGQQTYTMKLSDFDLATLEAAEQLGITTSNEVIVTLNGGIVIESNGEVKEIPIDTSATIPLGTTLLEIATTPQEVSDQFVSEEVVIEPVDPKVIAGDRKSVG